MLQISLPLRATFENLKCKLARNGVSGCIMAPREVRPRLQEAGNSSVCVECNSPLIDSRTSLSNSQLLEPWTGVLNLRDCLQPPPCWSNLIVRLLAPTGALYNIHHHQNPFFIICSANATVHCLDSCSHWLYMINVTQVGSIRFIWHSNNKQQQKQRQQCMFQVPLFPAVYLECPPSYLLAILNVIPPLDLLYINPTI